MNASDDQSEPSRAGRPGDDDARLLSSVLLAISAGAIKSTPDDLGHESLAELTRRLRTDAWMAQAARSLRPSVWTWVDKPWHCIKLRKLLRDLEEAKDEASLREQHKDIVRIAAMVEFGVDVNAFWYGQLRKIVALGLADAQELRSLLRSTAVWWGTSVKLRESDGRIVSRLKTLWVMGRPEAGALLVGQHSQFTRATLGLMCGLGAVITTIGVAVLCQRIVREHTVGDSANLIAGIIVYGLLTWGLWWLGPRSWSAADRLRFLIRRARSKSEDGERIEELVRPLPPAARK